MLAITEATMIIRELSRWSQCVSRLFAGEWEPCGGATSRDTRNAFSRKSPGFQNSSPSLSLSLSSLLFSSLLFSSLLFSSLLFSSLLFSSLSICLSIYLSISLHTNTHTHASACTRTYTHTAKFLYALNS
jgi:hypothetical protein